MHRRMLKVTKNLFWVVLSQPVKFEPNPSCGLADYEVADRHTDKQTSSFIYKIIYA